MVLPPLPLSLTVRTERWPIAGAFSISLPIKPSMYSTHLICCLCSIFSCSGLNASSIFCGAAGSSLPSDLIAPCTPEMCGMSAPESM